jgi:phosphatidylglycerophosphate synthase
MSDRSRRTRSFLRFTPLLGIALLVYLLTTVKFSALAGNAKAIGWGMLVVLALGGFSHVVKTWAWRLSMLGEARNVSFGRTLGLRLISEVFGQLGVIGMVGGEATRVSLLGSGVSVAGAISSVTLDRGLFILAGALVTIAGILSLLFVVSVSHTLYLYASVLVLALVCLLIAGAIALQRKWPVLSGLARGATRIPWFRRWLQSKESTIRASEQRIIEFYHRASGVFWLSVLLNLLCHFLAIVEVYLILKMLGAPATLLGALILESLTKLINVAGAANPGNVGTYEGGNMVIGRLVQLSGTQGLLLALCRRVRGVFWAIAGGICLVWFSKWQRAASVALKSQIETSTTTMPAEEPCPSLSLCQTVFILAHDLPGDGQFEPALAKVATLPVLLRTILGVRSKEHVRIIVVVRSGSGRRIRAELSATGRLQGDTEWMEIPVGATLSSVLKTAGLNGGQVAFIMGGSIYRPNLLRMLHEWNGDGGAIEFVSSGKPIGLVALSSEMAAPLAADSGLRLVNEVGLHHWITEKVDLHGTGLCPLREVDEESWQAITGQKDCVAAERKLDCWLVKSTDGLFARMNRRVSIPISRQLIKTPITPNMVSLFTLALSLIAGLCFAFGGYWNCLTGAFLGVWGSILDGCDGEVARLKLQVSDFGCWLDTICDYLYYFVTFAGVIIGVLRTKGDPSLVGWSIAVFAGAILTFIVAGIGRKRLAGDHPEEYLQRWQSNAERRSAGLLVRMARHAEFVVRRCFLPYWIFVLALLNLTPALIYMAAIGANLAWIISLRSVISFSMRSNSAAAEAGA